MEFFIVFNRYQLTEYENCHIMKDIEVRVNRMRTDVQKWNLGD